MVTRIIRPQDLDSDFLGNNAAFTCPMCNKVFIVSGFLSDRKRQCPNCGKSTGYVKGGAKSGGRAFIEYPDK